MLSRARRILSLVPLKRNPITLSNVLESRTVPVPKHEVEQLEYQRGQELVILTFRPTRRRKGLELPVHEVDGGRRW